MTWPVYREYRVEYHNDLPVLVAPEPEPHFRSVRDDMGTRLLDDIAQIDFGVERHYAPLLHPEIVLRLAEIGDSGRSGPLTPETMQAWAETWGLLGVRDETGRQESIADFYVAARNVARTLRLVEAATANNDNGDEAKLRDLLQEDASDRLRAMRERALDEVEARISDALRARAYPAVYWLRERHKGREDEQTVGFDGGEGFHDLLGAVYLLLSYLIRDPASRRCKQCNEFMDPNKYSSSYYCSARCKQQAWRDREKAKKQAAR